MNICDWCGVIGGYHKGSCRNHPDNLRASRAKVAAAERIADRHAAEFIDASDPRGGDLYPHIRAAIADAVLDAWGVKP